MDKFNGIIVQESNKSIRKEALAKLKGNWIPIIFSTLIVYPIFMMVLLFLSLGLGYAILGGALSLCFANYYLKVVRKEAFSFGDLFSRLDRIVRSFTANFLMVFFCVLWSFLFFIPGIVQWYKYALVYYIMVDDKEISAFDAMKKSTALMKGNKMQLFKMHLHFMFLSIFIPFTFYIGLLWLLPYLNALVFSYV
jgi:uncharacterized membrane protein